MVCFCRRDTGKNQKKNTNNQYTNDLSYNVGKSTNPCARSAPKREGVVGEAAGA